MDGSPGDGDGKYQSALSYLYGRINYERTARGVPQGAALSLDRMRELLAELGNPQDSLKAIHIAGTKGKGSTAAMIATALTAAGYKTGLYTSPHLQHLGERIAIDGVDCRREDLVELVELIRPVVATLDERRAAECHDGSSFNPPTFFEITTAMAMLHFARQAVDAAVLEVGLGGRLDSTNVCRPVVTVITSISFDHTKQLGNTLAEIAREKAGIIKPGVPVICGVTNPEPQNAIQHIADDLGAPLQQLGKDFTYTYTPPSAEQEAGSHGTLDYRESSATESIEISAAPIGMLGRHQAANAAIAVATLRQLQRAGWHLPESAIRAGVGNARAMARVEVVSQKPLVILDTAHNLASITALLSALEDSFASRPRILIFAATRDKDVSGMLKQLLPQFETVILTRYIDNPRGVASERLVQLVAKVRDDVPNMPTIIVSDSPRDAWDQARSLATSKHIVCVTGSFFLAAEMRPIIDEVG